jgi:tRNA G37 N-methylase Trm5
VSRSALRFVVGGQRDARLCVVRAHRDNRRCVVRAHRDARRCVVRAYRGARSGPFTIPAATRRSRTHVVAIALNNSMFSMFHW